MDDVKDKVKGLMKKVNNPFSSSTSGKFKGQGRVLGSSSSSSSSYTPSNSNPTPRPNPSPSQNPNPNSKPKPKPTSPVASDNSRIDKARKPGDGFDPFDSLVTSSQRSQNGYSLNVYECPICKKPFRSEDEVSEHVDNCLSNPTESIDGDENCVSELQESEVESNTELEIFIGTYVSGKPSEGSIDVVLKLLRNIVREPENVKFRKIRMNNPKIKEAIADVIGGVELLSFLGFELKEENGETWALMEAPREEEKINFIKKAIVLLEPQLVVQDPPKRDNLTSTASVEKVVTAEPKKIDRQVIVILIIIVILLIG